VLISRAVTVKSRVTPNLRSQLAAETQKAMRELDAEAAKAGSEKERSDLMARKDDLVRQLKEIAKLEDGQEIVRGQIQGFWELRVGDIWPLVLSSEIVVEDGRVVEIREGQAVMASLAQGAGGFQK
jgi:hypothetical protein